MRSHLLLLAVLVFSTPAWPQVSATLLEQVEREVSLEPGKIEEPCFAMAMVDRLEFGFEGSAPLDFNIHYHQGDSVYFPVDMKQLSAHEGVFIATGSRQYCLMWTNRGEVPVSLRYRYGHYRAGAPQ